MLQALKYNQVLTWLLISKYKRKIMENKLSIKDVFTASFQTFIKHWKILLLSLLAYIGLLIFGAITYSAISTAILVLIGGVKGKLTTETIIIISPIIIIGSFILSFIYTALWGGFIKIGLNICKTGSAHIRDIFYCFSRMAFKLFSATILYQLLIVLGLTLLILPSLLFVGQPSVFLGAGFVEYILYRLLTALGLILFVIPIYFAVKFSLYPYFIIDQDCGIIDSLTKSSRAVKNNFFNVLLIFLISLLLYFIPIISIPFIMLVWVYVYLMLKNSHGQIVQ